MFVIKTSVGEISWIVESSAFADGNPVFFNNFKNDDTFIPSLYMRFKFPFGEPKRTHWVVFNAGLQLKIQTTATRKNDD